MKCKPRKKLKSMVSGTALIALCLALFTGCAAQNGQSNSDDPVLPDIEGNYKIVEVVDGETITVMWGHEERNVKLLGVTVPDDMQKEATNFLKEELSTVDVVSLEFDQQDKDRAGNLLAYVYHPDDLYTSLNIEMLTNGYARMEDSPRNDRYSEEMRSAVNQARQDRAGLWATDEGKPWERKG